MTTDFLTEPLAIIGMNCLFPGINADVEDVDAFYDMLIQGQTPIREMPENRWDIDKYYDPNRKKADKIVSRKGGFLRHTELFDAAFFKISSAAAKQIDPQHRLFLEVAIRALNHANIRLDSLQNSNTGVYCGISTHEYGQLNYKDNIRFNAYTPFGVAHGAAVGRLCHFLNLKGPSMAVDTACSSSLSALYLAATALRTKQCEMAIVGGVHLSLCPETFIGLTKANMLSATGKCSSFDNSADGFARSEGCGVVIVKRLSDALNDKDRIHAVIRSITMNQDGDGASLAAPNLDAQIAMHQDALKQANLSPADIDYIEAHGTGTLIGDSVEFNAIEQVHQGQHSKDKPLIIGALKSNLGHSITSSGIASLIKAVTTLTNEHIPPNLHYSTPNRLISPERIPAHLPTQPLSFTRKKDKKRYVHVSNYSFSGTNVGLILEESPDTVKQINKDNTTAQCFVLSANSEHSLRQMLAQYIPYLQQTTSSLSDICNTLINCRDHFKYRCALRVKDKNQLIKAIETDAYELVKVVPQEGISIQDKAEDIETQFNSGANIKTNSTYNKADLPLYCFDRKPYWHEARPNNSLLQSHLITQDHLNRYMQQMLMPDPVHRQPIIQVLNPEPIAIIGMSCRFPKAANIDEFLSLLQRGESGMSDIPIERWDNDKYYSSDLDAPGCLYIKQLGLIDHVRQFDAEFFNISPREAKLMSPQLRVFMEASYHALEDANLSLDAVRDSNTGVFVGVGTNEYPRVLAHQGVSLEDLNIYFATGNVLNALAGRVAYAFDFHGPIQAIDTACSSAMTAIHNACLSLQSGDCSMAIAGGINILLSPESNITLSKARMLSPESRCKTFSEDADGYARSEGCGIVVLKRLTTAIEDKDTILAVIKGSAINSDGKSGGFTVPNGTAQEEVIRSALAKSQLSATDIDYIEAHGTATPLADPIEVNTLTRIFSDSHSPEKPLYISSVKTNIGHCESASGAAGLIKAVLSLQTNTLFKHLNFKKLNPGIQLKNTIIPLNTISWDKNNELKCAGVSSFGFSGANAHIILQQAPEMMQEARTLPQESLLVLSAKKKESLDLLLLAYKNYLNSTDNEWADICYTAANCRSHFLYRVVIKASSAREAAALIEQNDYVIHHVKTEFAFESRKASEHSLDEIQKAYQNGATIDWADVYSSLNTQFKKVKLPLYEFSRDEHWFEDIDKLKDATLPKDWCFQLQWEEQPGHQSIRKIQNNQWLFIGPRHLASGFQAQGLRLIFEEEKQPLKSLDGVIFAEGIDSAEAIDFGLQKAILNKLLNLIQTLNEQEIKLQLVILTSQAIAELAADSFNLNQSPLLGFCKTQVLELPQFNTLLIDADNPKDDAYASRIVEEINYNHSQNYEHLVAYRDGKRLVARLLKRHLVDKKRTLIGEGRYLITGGCGGLGLITAQALLSAGARELILISRNVDKPLIKTAIKKIQMIYPGRIIRTLSVDITDRERLGALLRDLNSDGLLKGIIHAAGAAIKASLLDHKDSDIDYLFSAKVQGGWNLHELSKGFDLDFFVVYSSISSVFGSNKESVYSATNSFLDALIAERQRLGLVGTSIQWGPWGEVGMAHKRTREHSLKQTVSNEQGQTFIKVLLDNQLSYATIISPDYLNFMLDFVPKPAPGFHRALTQDLGEAHPINQNNLSPWLKEYLDTPDRLNACKTMLHSICQTILERTDDEQLDDDEGFFELGFDSLMITELAAALKERLNPTLKITVSIGFDHPTINKLAQFLEEELDTHFIKTQSINPSSSPPADDSIAIIGMSCSLPNAPDIAAFEKLLEEGRSGIKEIPIERWDNKKYYDPNRDAPGKSYVTKLGLIENIKYFDAQFFGISPREAKFMEPQQRIFLECCYKALENANYHSSSLRGTQTGVYAGVGPNEYYAQLEKSGFSNEELSTYSITGNVLNLIPGRVAYTFDFKGPSISVDTACSSSLVAIHYACQGLKNRDIDYALAGGVNILLMPESNVTLCKANALSADGQCKTFDERADGYVRAEGCGVVLLKRLSDALRDKDSILAVIKASAINNDGKSAGLTVPNGKSQEEVMRKALSQSRLSPADISYIEAHGTGTPLGDPIEVHAINAVYAKQRSKDNPLYIGTVKTNIGHLESAAGVAGLIKTVIGLNNKKIYKHLNFRTLNPNININGTRIATENTHWQSAVALKSAGISAFGFSGTNAHIILQEHAAPATPKLKKPPQDHVLFLSAKSQTALDNLVDQYQRYLAVTDNDFGDICFTVATCRDHYSHRLVLVAQNTADASEMLQQGQIITDADDLAINSQLPKNQSLIRDYLRGTPIDWTLHYQSSDPEYSKVALPNYVFDLYEFWPDKKSESRVQTAAIHPLLGQMVAMPDNEYLFSQKLDLEHLSFIKQHRVFDKVIVPASAYIESGLAAAQLIFKTKSLRLEQLTIERPLIPKQDQDFQVQVKPKGNEHYQIRIFAKQEDLWQTFAEMDICALSHSEPQRVNIGTLKSQFSEGIDLSQIYTQFANRSLFYGEEFRVLQEGYVSSDSVLTHVVLTKASQQNYYYHPVLLDGAMQSMLLLAEEHTDQSTYVPYSATRITTYQESSTSIWIHLTRQESSNPKELCVEIKLYDNAGLLIGHIEGLKLRKVVRSHFISYEPCIQHFYQKSWSRFDHPKGTPANIPELLVLSQNEEKVKQLLGDLRYQRIDKLHNLVDLEHKNILFLYEQDQFHQLVECCQILFHSKPDCFILVTEHAYAINELDKVNPYHTMASAFWSSFRNEYDLNKNYTVDMDEHSSLTEALNHLFSAQNTEEQLAIRGALYIPRIRKKHLPINNIQLDTLFQSDATYLVVGGTGGLAKPFIEYLIARGVKHIIIASRSEGSSETKEWINLVRQNQIDIRHQTVDASNYQQMEQLIQGIENGSYPLKGVFHLAGVIHDGLIINLNESDNQAVLNAKMDAALILHQLTQAIHLDHFVLFSSSASLLGAAGQSNYAAANGFLDGLAHMRRHLGLPALAINWGPFKAIGMTAPLTQALKQHGFMPLEPEQIEILDVLLTSKLAQIAPCPMHWDIYAKNVRQPIGLSELMKTGATTDHYFLNTLRQHSPDERVALLSQVLCDITSYVLGLDNRTQITATDSLISLGLDSLMSIEIRNRIHDKLQCPMLSLSMEYFINDPTIEKIAAYISQELQKTFTEATDTQLIRSSSPAEIALCDFQYVFWVLNTFNHSFNIGMQIQLHGKLDIEKLSQAFDSVIQQNGAFWLDFNQDIPLQRVKKQGQFHLIYNDVSLENEPNRLNQEFNTNLLSMIPLTKQPLIRVYLYKVNNDLHELHVIIPHIIVDDASCAIIFKQFRDNYEALNSGRKIPQLTEHSAYLNFVKQNNRHYEKNLDDKINFWQAYNKGYKMLRFNPAFHIPNTANQPKHLYHYPIESPLVERFINWHKEKNLNVSTGLVAACQIVFLNMTQQNKIPVILIHSGREGSQYKHVVGLFSEYKRLNITLDKEFTFIDCVRAIEEELIKTAPYQKCSHLIKNQGVEGTRSSIRHYFTKAQNKLLLRDQFKKSRLHTKIIDYYLDYFSRIESLRTSIARKHRLNTLLNWRRPLQKPAGMRILLSITPSFFSRETEQMNIGELSYTFPNHFSCMDRPVGNETLWIYFSKNQFGEYQLSINAPLTEACKNQFALHLNETLRQVVEAD